VSKAILSLFSECVWLSADRMLDTKPGSVFLVDEFQSTVLTAPLWVALDFECDTLVVLEIVAVLQYVTVHSDLAGAWNILQSEGGPMARPAGLSAERNRDTDEAYWQWNDHNLIPVEFREQSRSLDQPSISKPARSQPG